MKSKGGFTLLEVMVVVAIIALTGLYLGQIYTNYIRLYALENVKVDLSLATQAALSDLGAGIREAVTALATSTILGMDFTSGGQTLILNVPAFTYVGDEEEKQIISDVYDRVVYYLSTTTPARLNKMVEPAPQSKRVSQIKILAGDVNLLNFEYNPAPPQEAKDIVATLALSRVVYGRTQTVTSTLRAVLRNK